MNTSVPLTRAEVFISADLLSLAFGYLRGRQPWPQDGVIVCYDIFSYRLRHHFATARKENQIFHSPDYISPPHAKNGLGRRLR